MEFETEKGLLQESLTLFFVFLSEQLGGLHLLLSFLGPGPDPEVLRDTP